MLGVVPGGTGTFGRAHPKIERVAAPVFTAVGLVALAATTLWAGLTDNSPPGNWPGTLALASGTAVWLLGTLWAFPNRVRHPVLVGVFFVGLLGFGAALMIRDDVYNAFLSVGYPFAFALFTARVSVFAVALTAVTPLLTRAGLGTMADSPLWVVLVSVVGPLLYAAYWVGRENDQRRKANDQLAESNRKLEQALEENAELQAKLLAGAREAGVLDERQRMAREIHDTLAQGLTGIITQLHAADRARDDPERWQRHLDQVHALAKESLTEARRSVRAMRPEPLAAARLPDAIADLARRWSESSGVPVAVETTGEPRSLLPELEIAVYRVAQEALTNIEKHAGATKTGVTLSYLDDVVLLDVRDDGTGFTPGECGPARDGSGFGLEGMRQRVARVSGTVVVESSPGEGTAVSAQIPAIPAERGEPQ
ncbi:sensor histidine kinase [Amycolatopsis sp. CA-230715]|uniref:sensor histidine kinase n=1 Tax=Amycolatopsis sp. CA-230715 TaxID=2745196 RepID=UPI001C32474A|nr:sensor histidine kinase [Amycolatopsis sp. CA-230715]QWF79366.1 hypothetical protein HUW46_02774 [Amycolatopsis sp. CA-230715]